MDISKYSDAPCSAFTDDDLIEMALDTGQQVNPGGHRSCRWQAKPDPDGQILVAFENVSLRPRYDYAASHPGAAKAGRIVGYPAVSTTNPSGRLVGCDVAVAVGPATESVVQQVVHVTIQASKGNACGSAESIAKVLITVRLAPGH